MRNNNDHFSGDLFDQANEWYHRLHGDSVTEADRRAFCEWCAQSPDHEAAWEEVQTFAADIRMTLARPPVQATVPSLRRARRLRQSVLAIGMAAIALMVFVQMPSSWMDRFRADYLTGHGERRTIALADGTTVILDTDTALKLLPESDGRGVTLLHGEAWFAVHHDAQHPFRVLSGNGRITDVGTRFDVRHLDQTTTVAVQEGIVDVSVGSSSTLPPDHLRLNIGQGVTYGPRGLGGAQEVDPSTIASWRTGTLVFQQRPLREVIAELNRYEGSHLVLAAFSGRDRPISGTFMVGTGSKTLPALQEALGLRGLHLTPWVTVLY
ncbi:FecR family protein [Acetobacter vaccinii]|uniref:FecR family protein n=1 Tax=Acetobacter vaccinii TaxID=2592655 RepID=A0A5C1YRB7_9PROT|nr:FecR family protein [Acetobacter vaccinii]QEO18158.1 FecR family protein [Acetobacter vaccinii]